MNKRPRSGKSTPKPEIDIFDEHPEEPPSRGPSLVAMYIALAVALAVAIGLAALIVLPFYRRIAH